MTEYYKPLMNVTDYYSYLRRFVTICYNLDQLQKVFMMKRLLTLTAIGTILCCSDASASGFLLREQSVAAMGNAFAGATAGAEDVSYSFYNPAAIIKQTGTKATLGATAIVGNVKGYEGKSPFGFDREMDNVVDKAVLPSFAISHQLNDQVTVGLNLNSPFGLVTDYSKYWSGANHGTLSHLRTYDLMPMAAYRANEHLSFGAGLNIQYVTAELKNSAGTPYLNHAKLKGDTTDLGYVLGALYEYSPATRFGVSYRSEVKHKLKGKIQFDRYIPTGNIATTMRDQDISARLTTPALLTFGAYHDINEKWAVMAEVQKTYWSSFEDLDIQGAHGLRNITEENWKDVWFYSIGASYKVDDQWKLKVGFAFDQTPVSIHTRTPRIPDSDRIWYSGGVEYKYDDNWTFNAGYTYIRAEKSKVELKNDPARGDLHARYKGNIHLFGFSVNYNF